MKTVSGKVFHSKPISLKKATSTLSSFISTETGASPAICAYLRRALASFTELKQIHKELGVVPRPKGQHERPKSEVVSQGEVVLDYPTRSVEVSQAPIRNNRSHRSESNHRPDPTRDAGSELETPGRSVESGRETGHEDGGNVGLESERKKHRKKKKNEVGNFENNGVEAKEGDDRGKMRTTEEVKKEESKKRKNEEVEEKGVDGSEEQRSKKKKRRKTD